MYLCKYLNMYIVEYIYVFLYVYNTYIYIYIYIIINMYKSPFLENTKVFNWVNCMPHLLLPERPWNDWCLEMPKSSQNPRLLLGLHVARNFGWRLRVRLKGQVLLNLLEISLMLTLTHPKDLLGPQSFQQLNPRKAAELSERCCDHAIQQQW